MGRAAPRTFAFLPPLADGGGSGVLENLRLRAYSSSIFRPFLQLYKARTPGRVLRMASTVWKGQLQFGLVSLPIRLYSAARGETVSFNLLHAPDHSRIRQVTFCQAEDKPVPRNELVKGYEYEKDRYVVIEDEDLKNAAPSTAKVMEIIEFVKTEEVDPVYFESSYYMAPDDAGEKPYALLFNVLKKTGYVG